MVTRRDERSIDDPRAAPVRIVVTTRARGKPGHEAGHDPMDRGLRALGECCELAKRQVGTKCDAGDRDAVSAVLASFVVLAERGVAASATVDYEASAEALRAIRSALTPATSYQGWQDTLSESTGLSARDGLYVAWSTPTPDSLVVARRTAGTAACSTRNELGLSRTTSDRTRWRTSMFHASGTPDFWDNS